MAMGDKSARKPKAKAGTKPRSKVTAELYEEILLWYAEHGQQHMKASKVFGLARRTLSGLFFEGAPHLDKPPMRLLVQSVEVKARALRNQLKKEELARANQQIQDIIDGTAAGDTLSRAIDDSVRARAEEGAVVSAGRRNILKLQSMLAPLLTGAVDRMKVLERDIKHLAPEDLVKLMKDLAKLQMDLISAAKTNMEMERLLLGDPSAGKDTEQKQLDPKSAMKVLDMAARTMARMRQEGKLLDGVGETTETTALDLTQVDGEEDDYEDGEEVGPELGDEADGDDASLAVAP